MIEKQPTKSELKKLRSEAINQEVSDSEDRKTEDLFHQLSQDLVKGQPLPKFSTQNSVGFNQDQSNAQ